MTSVLRPLAVLAALIAISLFAVACGDDDEDSGTDSNAPEASASEEPSARAVTLTADEYTFELSATPTADTKKVTFKNEGEQFHVLIFARLNEGFTLEEAIKMQGEGGSAEMIGQTEARPGKSEVVRITRPLKPGRYAMLCPLPSPRGPHYKLGQLQEFEIQ